jgi:hypothetical protein
MALDLALHAHGRIRGELRLPAPLAAVDGSDQRHVPDLDEVVERFSATGEAARDRVDERKVSLDHASTRGHEINAKSFSHGLQSQLRREAYGRRLAWVLLSRRETYCGRERGT